ncbi:hypothetical protein [Aliiglaciecola lipolytica]|uniref:hypothetical protein n=1 Tax=Aliiglaciecola lipolytica TaxID=477689 RepID=UPI001C096B37|nr:hypothetical protein [Aliiglaciecola lipolytica]MBU2876889.1 hypothetical protein [Aliiglaciecola lipolytica]
MLKLDYWLRRWQRVSLDPTNGKCWLNWLPSKYLSLCGWAYKYRGTWYSLYCYNNSAVFRAGSRYWNISEKIYAQNIRIKNIRKFCLFEDNSLLFSIEYNSLDRASDPTFDNLDLEAKDFFYWTTKLVNDKRFMNKLLRIKNQESRIKNQESRGAERISRDR